MITKDRVRKPTGILRDHEIALGFGLATVSRARRIRPIWACDARTPNSTVTARPEVRVLSQSVNVPWQPPLQSNDFTGSPLSRDSLRTYLESVRRELRREFIASLPVAPAADPAAVHAPPPPAPEPALRLRLRLHDSPGTEHEGTLLRSSPDSLWIVEEDSQETLRYARSSLLQVQSYNHSTPATGKGALIGGGIGLAAAIGLTAAYSSEAEEGSTGAFVLGTAVFTAGGALLGAFIGSAIKKEVWVDASGLGFSFEASPESMKMSVGIGRLKSN